MKKVVLSVCLLILFSAGSAFAQKEKPLFTGAIGVQSYTYRNSFPTGVAATLDTIKALGITEMEGPNPKNTTPEEFKKMLDERGISMPSLGADYNAITKDPEPFIKLAKTFGSKYIMVAWIPHGKTFTIDDAKKAVDDFNRAGKVLAENGITLCYHDHGYEFGPYEDGTLFDYIVKNTDPKYVSFEMDMLWTFHGGGDPAKLLYKYKDRWKLMHLKDIRKGIANDLTGGTDTRNDVALGTGQINVPEVLKAAKAIGIKHYFIEDESPNHAAQIPVTIAYIKSLKE
ncbi:sugar phosphate isomerase/epimerase family protein [Mucilaginibacter ginsenosidivorans]|uniref:Sugar phosphate isomerase/epimerase n=1 Tax=Mucilaginibacter ginsenosidivorans TaxID=398053 RepID=A0A5B8V1G5_9SPHI|nr:sugar phosphate isomerase/epimerase [Mucilaginibacter ginsenosidivorans]QEC65009.1 sugar phosphate isomerase/epimerase [Mucilaginibacter ginsenosidivorans]